MHTNKAAAVFCLLPLLVGAVKEAVQVGCNEYVGSSSEDGITRWLGIRYAAPPVGKLRFAPPREPPCMEDRIHATEFGDACISTGRDEIPKGQSEDCLFLNVFAPTNASREAPLPVFFFIQGGGFNELADPRLDAGDLVASTGMGMVVVTLNYRVGPYGFLTNGRELAANNGLRDQRAALLWVQEHAEAFGGSPDRVVLAGASAGGASVSLHLVAYGGADEGLFHGAAAESPSFAPVLTAAESQYLYDNLAIQLGCAVKGRGKGEETASTACLRGRTAREIQAASSAGPYPGGRRAPIYAWGPGVDGDMFDDRTYRLYAEGRFARVPAIFGDDTDGGTIFAPRDAASRADADAFLHDQYPDLTLAQLARLHELYPYRDYAGEGCQRDGEDEYEEDGKNDDSGKDEDDGGKDEDEGGQDRVGCYYRQAAAAYGDMRFACPALWAAGELARRGVPAWRYRYDVRDRGQVEAGLGVPHTAEMTALFGPRGPDPPRSYLPGGPNARAIEVLRAYWVSFVRHLDPNTGRAGGAAEWRAVGDAPGHRLRFGTGGETAMEDLGPRATERCEFLIGIGVGLKQ